VPIAWIERLEEVSRVEWQAVFDRSGVRSPFLSPAFLLPWAGAYAGGRAVRIARWEREGEACGFLFLCARGDGGPGWELMGGHDVSDILDALVVSGQEAAFWDETLGEADGLLSEGSLLLQCLVAGTPTLDLLALRCPAFGLSLSVEEIERSPYLTLPSTFEAYVEGLDKKARHELRRKMRRAAETLPDHVLRICREPGDVAAAIPSFLELHRRSHPDKAVFMSEGMARFFREIALRWAEAGALRLAFLSCCGSDVAAAFQVVAGDRMLLYNSGYDPSRRDANPGLVLNARCIEAAIDEGFREYDFLRGTERYKYDLGGVDRAVYRATISRS
jgi:CelD/BcsL family acetyltransferase involved in cellulose biosynthesis